MGISLFGGIFLSLFCALTILSIVEALQTAFSLRKSVVRSSNYGLINKNVVSRSSFRNINSSLMMKPETKPEPMKKAEFIGTVAEQAGVTKTETDKIVKAILEVIIEEISNNKQISIPGFGTFLSKERKARTQVNPRTGEKMQVEASRTPAFNVAKAFKEQVKSAFSGTSPPPSLDVAKTPEPTSETSATLKDEAQPAGKVSELNGVSLKSSASTNIPEPVEMTDTVLDLKTPQSLTSSQEAMELMSPKSALKKSEAISPKGNIPKNSSQQVEPMKKADFISILAERAELPKSTTDTILKAILEVIVEEVAGGSKINYPGFGSFEARERSARSMRNPQTGEMMDIEATKSPVFNAAKGFKDKVKSGFEDSLLQAIPSQSEVKTRTEVATKETPVAAQPTEEVKTTTEVAPKEAPMASQSTKAPSETRLRPVYRAQRIGSVASTDSSKKPEEPPETTSRPVYREPRVVAEKTEEAIKESNKFQTAVGNFFGKIDYVALTVNLGVFAAKVSGKLASFGLKAAGYAFGAGLNAALKAKTKSQDQPKKPVVIDVTPRTKKTIPMEFLQNMAAQVAEKKNATGLQTEKTFTSPPDIGKSEESKGISFGSMLNYVQELVSSKEAEPTSAPAKSVEKLGDSEKQIGDSNTTTPTLAANESAAVSTEEKSIGAIFQEDPFSAPTSWFSPFNLNSKTQPEVRIPEPKPTAPEPAQAVKEVSTPWFSSFKLNSKEQPQEPSPQSSEDPFEAAATKSNPTDSSQLKESESNPWLSLLRGMKFSEESSSQEDDNKAGQQAASSEVPKSIALLPKKPKPTDQSVTPSFKSLQERAFPTKSNIDEPYVMSSNVRSLISTNAARSIEKRVENYKKGAMTAKNLSDSITQIAFSQEEKIKEDVLENLPLAKKAQFANFVGK